MAPGSTALSTFTAFQEFPWHAGAVLNTGNLEKELEQWLLDQPLQFPDIDKTVLLVSLICSLTTCIPSSQCTTACCRGRHELWTDSLLTPCTIMMTAHCALCEHSSQLGVISCSTQRAWIAPILCLLEWEHMCFCATTSSINLLPPSVSAPTQIGSPPPDLACSRSCRPN
jgi:hypothetical protein